AETRLAQRLGAQALDALGAGGLIEAAPAQTLQALQALREPARDATTRYDWLPNGQLASLTDAEGGVERYAYNAFGERTAVARAVDALIEGTLEGTPLGRVMHETLSHYDRRGLLVRQQERA